MALDLRPYQKEAVEAIEARWGASDDNGRTLLVQATGTGKTVVMDGITERAVAAGGRVLLLAHRDELISQAQDKFKAFSDLDCAIEKASSHAMGSLFPVTLASVQTLGRPGRLAEYPRDHFTHILIDEAHHALASGYRAVLDHFEGARVLGVTATPDRADRRGLAEVFDSIAYEYPLDRAIREGYLTRIVAQLVPIEIDISDVRVQAGDFQARALDESLDPYLPEIASKMLEAGCDRRHTVVFLPLVRTAERMAAELNAVGISTEEIDGNSPDRADIIARFERGETSCLCCSMLLTEGWDCPVCDCVVVLRPTRSRALFAQMVGRGTRLHPGKDHLLLLDFLWNAARHDLCRPASLVAKTADMARRITDIEEGGGCDLLEAEAQAERDAVADREASLARELAAQRRKKSRLVDPLLFTISIEAADIADYEPVMPQDMLPPTDRQIAAIERFGLSTEGIDCFGKASMVLDRLVRRAEGNMATPKQIRQLERCGFPHPGTWTFAQASKVMSILSAHQWRVPRWLDPKTYDPNGEAA